MRGHDYDRTITCLWLAWLIYWVISAANTKSTERRESGVSRFGYVAALLLGAWLIFAPRLPWGALSQPLWLPSPWRSQLAVILVGLGFAGAVWARVHLGRNWSGTVTVKQGHELIRTGPYAYVRHPIYTGLLAAFLGSALECNEPRALLGFALILGSFLYKLRIEERFMNAQFPDEYARYCAQTPALVPFTKARQSAPR